jgi:hypothetical protein
VLPPDFAHWGLLIVWLASGMVGCGRLVGKGSNQCHRSALRSLIGALSVWCARDWRKSRCAGVLGVAKTTLANWVQGTGFLGRGLEPPGDPEERHRLSSALRRIGELELGERDIGEGQRIPVAGESEVPGMIFPAGR